jgi:hypothetical protein
MVKRNPTSINIKPELWLEVRKTALDRSMTATEFLEAALEKELARHQNNKS